VSWGSCGLSLLWRNWGGKNFFWGALKGYFSTQFTGVEGPNFWLNSLNLLEKALIGVIGNFLGFYWA